MTAPFDAYHKWLGIPPAEQPPNHYRLLAIPPFENDPDVIEAAVDQRMAHLKTFQLGKHNALSEQLLSEVAKARVCLLQPAKKQIYDTRLRASMGTVQQYDKTPAITSEPVLVPPVQEPSPGSIPASLRDISPMSKHSGKRRTSTKRTVVWIVAIILFGVIGVSAGCFVVFLINPQRPSVASLVDSVHDTNVVKQSSTAPSCASIPQQKNHPRGLQSSQQPSRQSSRQQDMPLASRSPQIGLIPPEPDLSGKKGDSQPPQNASGNDEASKGTAAPLPPETRQIVVLDFSRRVQHTKLPENVKGGKTAIRVEDVTGLETPYKLQPDHGIVSHGQPVDVVLTDYPGVSINLTVKARNGTGLDVSPQIDTGQGKKVEFTKKRVKQLCVNAVKDNRKLNQQLLIAQTEAKNIEAWLASPVLKTLQMRGKKQQQLVILNGQTIPALQKQVSYMQAHMVLLQRLSKLVKQTASITIVTSSSPESEKRL